jgi:integrase
VPKADSSGCREIGGNGRSSAAGHTEVRNPKIVQERFGHSSIAITMDIYSHLMPNIQEGAAAAVDDALRAAINRRSKNVG